MVKKKTPKIIIGQKIYMTYKIHTLHDRESFLPNIRYYAYLAFLMTTDNFVSRICPENRSSDPKQSAINKFHDSAAWERGC